MDFSLSSELWHCDVSGFFMTLHVAIHAKCRHFFHHNDRFFERHNDTVYSGANLHLGELSDQLLKKIYQKFKKTRMKKPSNWKQILKN